MVIYKYLLDSYIEVPLGSELIDIQRQSGGCVAWFLVDETQTEKEVRKFKIVYTGDKFDNDFFNNLKHIKTLQSADIHTQGVLVDHVFEIIAK